MPKIPTKQLSISRTLRQKQTPWETILWSRLRAKRLFNYRFRRQFNIEKFIVDFYCHQKGLVIELDGSQHKEKEALELDKKRDEILAKNGYKILRFNNNDIINNLEGVLLTIQSTLE